MNLTTLRTIGIILALTVVVWLVPGGGQGADLVGQVLSAVFIGAIVALLAQFYRRSQSDIYGLGDQLRLVLYASLGTLLLLLAGAGRMFDSGVGSILWFVLMALSVYGLFTVWRHWRAYA